MSEVNVQTVKLEKGRHSSPEEGVCVMELASMLAGEEFSDRPRSVSPAIAGFLRSYNDLLDPRRRQDLYRLAADVIGTSGSQRLEAERAARIRAWGEGLQQSTRLRRILSLRSRRSMAGRHLRPHEAGPFAVRCLGRVNDRRHSEVLALLDELVTMRAPVPAERHQLSGGQVVWRTPGSVARLSIARSAAPVTAARPRHRLKVGRTGSCRSPSSSNASTQ